MILPDLSARKLICHRGLSARLDTLLFGEAQGRIVISVAPAHAEEALACSRDAGIQAARLGTVGGSALIIQAARRELSWDLNELHDLWWNALARLMNEA